MAQTIVTHRGAGQVDRWRGSAADAGALMRAAYDAVCERAPESDPHNDVIVHYRDDTTEQFQSLADYEAAVSRIKPQDVRYITSNTWNGSAEQDNARIMFGLSGYGFEVTVTSRDRLWAHGLAETLKEQAKENEAPTYLPDRRPLRWYEWGGLLGMVLALAGWCTYVALDKSWSGDLPLALTLGLMIGLAFGMPLSGALDRRVFAPRFELVRVGEPPRPEPKKSFSIRAREWIQARPLLSVAIAIFSTLTLDLVGNALYDAVK